LIEGVTELISWNPGQCELSPSDESVSIAPREAPTENEEDARSYNYKLSSLNEAYTFLY